MQEQLPRRSAILKPSSGGTAIAFRLTRVIPRDVIRRMEGNVFIRRITTRGKVLFHFKNCGDARLTRPTVLRIKDSIVGYASRTISKRSVNSGPKRYAVRTLHGLPHCRANDAKRSGILPLLFISYS
jgi:hypothetical protein